MRRLERRRSCCWVSRMTPAAATPVSLLRSMCPRCTMQLPDADAAHHCVAGTARQEVRNDISYGVASGAVDQASRAWLQLLGHIMARCLRAVPPHGWKLVTLP